MAGIVAARLYDGPFTTELASLTTFWPVEPEHDDCFACNPGSGYCRVVVAPKVAKFRKAFADRLRSQAA